MVTRVACAQLCGMRMACAAIDQGNRSFLARKIAKYPEVDRSATIAWLKTISDCAGYASAQCHTDSTCTSPGAAVLQPGIGGSSCHPYGWGPGTPEETKDGTCCNSVAAAVMRAKLMEPGVDTILACWCVRACA